MKVIFVRHGQTVFNVESRYQGYMDAKLSEIGIRQAEQAAERLASEKIDAIYASDLSRAADTARLIASYHGLSLNIDSDLRECGFGDWEGLTVSEIKSLYSELYENYRKDSVRFRAPGGERLEHLTDRVAGCVNRIAKLHPDDTVLIVTHGGPIRAFFCHALGAALTTFRKINLGNAGITVFKQGNGGLWQLISFNDTCHLGALSDVAASHDETSAADKK